MQRKGKLLRRAVDKYINYKILKFSVGVVLFIRNYDKGMDFLDSSIFDTHVCYRLLIHVLKFSVNVFGKM